MTDSAQPTMDGVFPPVEEEEDAAALSLSDSEERPRRPKLPQIPPMEFAQKGRTIGKTALAQRTTSGKGKDQKKPTVTTTERVLRTRKTADKGQKLAQRQKPMVPSRSSTKTSSKTSSTKAEQELYEEEPQAEQELYEDFVDEAEQELYEEVPQEEHERDEEVHEQELALQRSSTTRRRLRSPQDAPWRPKNNNYSDQMRPWRKRARADQHPEHHDVNVTKGKGKTEVWSR